DYDSIVDRLVGAAAFQRAVDVLTEWKSKFPDSPKARQIDAAIFRNLYSLRANPQARAHAEAFLKAYPDDSEARAAEITLFRLDVREGNNAGVERRGRAIFEGEIQGTTLAERQAAGRLLAEYLVSIGQGGKALRFFNRADA